MFMSATVGGGATVTVLLAMVAGAYAPFAYPLFRIAKQTRDCGDDAWFAWIPVLNVILMCRVAGVSGWTALVLLLSWIPIFGLLISLVYTLVLWVKIGQRFDRTGLAVLAALLPVIGAWVFAFTIRPEPAY